MGKKSIRPNVGGWIFYIAKDPKEFLWSTWRVARVYDAGLLPCSPDNNFLAFEGITIRNQEFVGDVFDHEIRLEIIDWKEIRPGFFRLWEAQRKDWDVKGESILEYKEWLENIELTENKEPKAESETVGARTSKNPIIINTPKYQRISTDAKDIILAVNEKTGESSKTFLTKRMKELAHLDGRYENVLEVFEQQAKKFRLEYDDIAELVVNNFVTEDTLDRWKRDRKKRNRN